MEQPKTSERLASLEAKMGILLDLLKEIRDELKSHPSREEYEILVERVEKLEDNYAKLIWKVAGVAGGLSVLITIVGLIIDLLLRK